MTEETKEYSALEILILRYIKVTAPLTDGQLDFNDMYNEVNKYASYEKADLHKAFSQFQSKGIMFLTILDDGRLQITVPEKGVQIIRSI